MTLPSLLSDPRLHQHSDYRLQYSILPSGNREHCRWEGRLAT